jgi:hypothetical protein
VRIRDVMADGVMVGFSGRARSGLSRMRSVLRCAADEEVDGDEGSEETALVMVDWRCARSSDVSA